MRWTCQAIGCRGEIVPSVPFCGRHAAMLQSDTRRVLEKTFRPGKRPSKRLDAALAFAMQEILFYQTNGHRMMHESAFEW